MAPRPPTPSANLFAPSGCMPSTQTLALALAIVKTTPTGVSSRGQFSAIALLSMLIYLDYVLQLRTHLKLGRQTFAESEQSRYLDLVAYWQQRCEAAEHECKELNKKVASLERSVHCLGNLTVDPPDEEAQLNLSPSKKKGPASAAKRPRNPRSQAAKPPTPDEILEDDLQLFEKLGNRKSCTLLPVSSHLIGFN